MNRNTKINIVENNFNKSASYVFYWFRKQNPKINPK